MTHPRTGHRLRTAETLVPVVVLGVGILYGYQSVQEGIGTASNTGAGFFPFIVSVVLVASCVVVLLQEYRSAPQEQRTGSAADFDGAGASAGDGPGTSWRRVFGVLLASLAVPLLAETVGFVVTLSVAVVVIAKIMGMPGLLRPAILAASFGISAWFIFVYWLFVPLPAGILGLA